ncbi:MAG TPA: twin-arginine translocase subunit TatC [Chitinophagales bacterium]|nr:twin-arginine translocase subunit TatC [Chitinophagales bacterium]
MNPLSKSSHNDSEMPFLEHVEVLRWHIVRSLITIAAASAIVFVNKTFVFDTLLFGPVTKDFITYRALCWVSSRIALGKALCIESFSFSFINIELAGQFMVHLKTSVLLGFIIAFPYIFWEFWRFVRPALHEREARYARGVVFFSSLLFFIGVLFGYFILIPTMLNFLGNYQVSAQVQNNFTLTNYIGFISMFMLASGGIFELPMVVYFFSKLGLLTPAFMRRYRRHAVVIILVAAAIITPSPDIGSQVLVFIPVYFLYEISIFISARVEKNRAAAVQ